MAGEQLGRIYEALVFNIAEKVTGKLDPQPLVTWNPANAELMVKPDVCIGPVEAPEAILLITRSGSRRDWHKKFWRTVGEIVDVRAKFPSARLINIVLGTEIKEELIAPLSLLVDATFYPLRAERAKLEEWMKAIVRDENEDFDKLIGRHIDSRQFEIAEIISELAECIRSSLCSSAKAWSRIASGLTARRTSLPKTLQNWSLKTAVRRGLAKLITFGDPEKTLNAIIGRDRVRDDLGAPMETFGWASKVVGGWRITDEQILSTLNLFERSTILDVLNRSSTAEIKSICADVSSDNWLHECASFLERNALKLKDPIWLASALLDCIGNPCLHEIPVEAPKAMKGSWLFRAVLNLQKLIAGRKQGYGYEQLIADVRVVATSKNVLTQLEHFNITQMQIQKAGNTDSLRRRLVDWVSGLHPARLEAWELRLLAIILSQRFAEHNARVIKAACRSLPAFTLRVTYEDRIGPYRYFEPLLTLIENALNSAGLVFLNIPRHETLMSKLAEGEREIATTPVVKCKSTLIYWKSAHGSHTHDKTKELCGRGFCLRHALDDNRRLPVPSTEIKRLILVLDGDFSWGQVADLKVAGWDELVSVRDIQCLPGLIV